MSDLPIESRLAALSLSTDALSFIDSGKVRIPSELVIDHRSIRMIGDGENTFSGAEEKNIAAAEHVIKMTPSDYGRVGSLENSQGSRTRQSSKNKREKARRQRQKIKAEKSKATDDDAGTTGGSNTG
ncbi:hypothetical protein I315_02436 [Cryptococcus gattii Ru294]|nr:hypothetical protein I315_02436 [Cryptococcus gattii Ru294]